MPLSAEDFSGGHRFLRQLIQYKRAVDLRVRRSFLYSEIKQ